MSAQVIDLRTHRVMLGRFVPTPIPALNAVRADVDDKVRAYCKSLGLSLESTGTCIATALTRLGNCGQSANAIAAGKEHANRICRANSKPKGDGPNAA